MESPIVVVATIVPKKAAWDEVVSILNATQADVHSNESGCELYALHTDDECLVMVEKWTGRAELDQHFAAPPFNALGGLLEGKLAAEIEIKELRPVPAGSPTQGQL
ncbi:antibiotic biosynthesis monooxygenase [Actinomycetospora sp. NBRC 106375]|uniref:putative quinol monooxygenase n=1 Tax=Actinomycetospora sp. NBRC 106375 TaxID=3032207 RepID=UPI0024A56A3A|nr:antibiotic biosynthesis monooxygenase [Actinomycetospora sp. NBRC 106375]GLZ49329.1 antibiotic biosynthesis monooxygenase [Actinomycetospora sp. NBRC 106375]